MSIFTFFTTNFCVHLHFLQRTFVTYFFFADIFAEKCRFENESSFQSGASLKLLHNRIFSRIRFPSFPIGVSRISCFHKIHPVGYHLLTQALILRSHRSPTATVCSEHIPEFRRVKCSPVIPRQFMCKVIQINRSSSRFFAPVSSTNNFPYSSSSSKVGVARFSSLQDSSRSSRFGTQIFKYRRPLSSYISKMFGLFFKRDRPPTIPETSIMKF